MAQKAYPYGAGVIFEDNTESERIDALASTRNAAEVVANGERNRRPKVHRQDVESALSLLFLQ